MYSIEFSELALKQFNKLEKVVQDRISSSLERIRIKPEAHVKSVVGTPFFSFRVGDYRLVIKIDKGKLLILIISVGHRSHIYSKF